MDDPERMSWGRIRVWNDDMIGAKSGFPPQAFDKKIHDDYDKWGPIIQAAGIKAE